MKSLLKLQQELKKRRTGYNAKKHQKSDTEILADNFIKKILDQK